MEYLNITLGYSNIGSFWDVLCYKVKESTLNAWDEHSEYSQRFHNQEGNHYPADLNTFLKLYP